MVLKNLVEFNGSKFEDLKVSVSDKLGKVLVAWAPDKNLSEEIPDPAKAAKQPKEIDTVEALYLQGLHLEQYRHATFSPIDYYEEGLRRAPGDVRCNNAMGLLNLRKGQVRKSYCIF